MSQSSSSARAERTLNPSAAMNRMVPHHMMDVMVEDRPFLEQDFTARAENPQGSLRLAGVWSAATPPVCPPPFWTAP